MPKWIHDRARHIQAKNPSMPEGEAWAIATQQSHAVGKSPKGYGTAEGRHKAKSKYKTPSDDKKTADPGHRGEKSSIKTAGIDSPLPAALLEGFSDEIKKIKVAQTTMSSVAPKPTVPSTLTSTIPRNTMKTTTPRYSQVNPAAAMQPAPTSNVQPMLSPPPVRS